MMKTTQERRDRIRAMIADYPGKRHEVTIHLLAGLLDDADRCAELEATIRAVLDVKEDKSLGWFWLENALKGDFER